MPLIYLLRVGNVFRSVGIDLDASESITDASESILDASETFFDASESILDALKTLFTRGGYHNVFDYQSLSAKINKQVCHI